MLKVSQVLESLHVIEMEVGLFGYIQLGIYVDAWVTHIILYSDLCDPGIDRMCYMSDTDIITVGLGQNQNLVPITRLDISSRISGT